MASELLKQLLGSVNVTESPYGTPADGPAADGASGPATEVVDTPPPEEKPAEDSTATATATAKTELEKPAPAPEKPVDDQRDAAFRALAKEKNLYRREVRQMQAELASLKAAQNRLAAPVVEPVSTQRIVFTEPDPIEAYIASTGGDPEVAIPAAKVKEHAAWMERKLAAGQAERERVAALRQAEQETQRRQQEQATAQAAQDATNSQVYDELATGPLSAEQIGEGLGLDDVSDLGSVYLTTADKELIRAAGAKHGPQQMWKTYYAQCIRRLEGSGTPEEAILRDRVKMALARRPAPSPAGPSAKTTSAPSKTKPVAPTREQVLPARGAAVLKRIGFPL